MTPATKEIVLRALRDTRGDDLERATAEFRGYTKEQMRTPYGGWGQTCQQILEGYRQRRAALDAAIAEVKAAP